MVFRCWQKKITFGYFVRELFFDMLKAAGQNHAHSLSICTVIGPS